MKPAQRQRSERIGVIRARVFAAASLGLITLRAPSGARDMTRLQTHSPSMRSNLPTSDITP
ncbi:hypothetical protein [Lysobacter enzymogenes]|uniref:hypothetical protein n=1 Tax=Lysobacter enzymogenes TaxID=69 RepID=UPI0011AB5A70|nr:hypothetical protein [Lysobacter enzymogenes]